MESQPFDNDAHEAAVAERYRRLAMFEAFDTFIDMSIDGVISRAEAIAGFTEEYGCEYETAPEGAA